MKLRLLLPALLCVACVPQAPVVEPGPEPSAEVPVSEDPSVEPSAEPSQEPKEPSSECNLYGMTFISKGDRIEAVVDEETLSVTFSYGYDQRAGLKNGLAEPRMSEGAKMTPDPTKKQDWLRSPQVVRVTAEDGKTFKKYTVRSEVLPAPRPGKPTIMWVDAGNSYSMLRTPEAVDEIVGKIYDAGFSGIAMEVKPPVSGDVLYSKSNILGYATSLKGGKMVNTSFDLLQAFIDACHKRDMTLTASYCIFTFAEPTSARSQEYYEANLKDAFCHQLLTSGIEDIREHPFDYWFLSPSHPAVHKYVMDVVTEIVTGYDIDGFALDYCRYPNIRSDFSPSARADFENYLGKPVENWPSDVMKVSDDSNAGLYDGNTKYFKQWMAWRAGVIQGYVKDIRDVIKAIRPSVALELWAACWFQYRNETGQNWGSSASNWASTHYSWASPEYDKAGFAEYMDIFHLGNYVKTIYGKSESTWSMEYFTSLAKTLVGDACTMYNSFGLYNGVNCDEATYYSYLHYDGLMVFELGAFVGQGQWDAFKSGYVRAMRELGEYSSGNN
ncbi:MAG: family 10 glycosylhydrolase [Bacteroidales bacterium]|nr:family 10 glycosylhydrolase [Bacteroidales bacterium]